MAAARAAARRQAILNSRGDRLAKLTSSARGEDPGGVYAHDGESHTSARCYSYNVALFIRSPSSQHWIWYPEICRRRIHTTYATIEDVKNIT